jgi:hypothetical protein
MTKAKKQNEDTTLTELQELANCIGYNIRYEKGDFEGGNCLLKDQKLILINKKLDPKKKINVLSKNIKEIGIDDIYIKPALRDIIEEEIVKK